MKTKREAVEEGLRTPLRLARQSEIRRLRGKLHWKGDLNATFGAALNFRALRKRGITSRKTIYAVIAARCIEGGYELLHSDRDFEPFVKYLGLRVA